MKKCNLDSAARQATASRSAFGAGPQRGGKPGLPDFAAMPPQQQTHAKGRSRAARQLRTLRFAVSYTANCAELAPNFEIGDNLLDSAINELNQA